MNKILLFFLALSFSLTACAQGDPSPFIKGQNATGLGNQASTVIVPYRQSTKINAYQALIETGNFNMLANGEFEGLASTVPSGWTCTTGTCTKTTTAGEFSSGKAAMKIVPAANVIDVSQSVTTTSGIQKQGFARVIYKVPNTCSTFQVLTTVDSATQTTVPTANLVYDDTFRSIEVPLTFGSTNAGIKFTASTTCTGNIFVDGAILAQGLGLQNLQGDNVYSAQADIAGAVSRLNKPGWVSFTSITSTYNFALTGFTVAPNCWANSSTLGGGSVRILNVSSTSSTLSIEVTGSTGVTATTTISFGCQKSGNDYLASSSNVYSQASANYSRRAYTPTFTGFGTVTGVSCYESRDGEFLDVDCKFTAGTTTATEARVSLPGTLTSSAFPASIAIAGEVAFSAAVANQFLILREPSTAYLTFSVQNGSNASLSKFNGNTLMSSGQTMSFKSRVPISGWSNSGVIVGSFENVPTVPGAGARIDIFSVSFGTTNATTACSASPCSYLDQIGSAVTSITRSGAGLYSLNTSKTYTKLKCTANTSNVLLAGAIACNNCSAVAVNNVSSVTTTYTDGYGTILCQGSY